MNGLAACLEYGTSSWMCISDGHNGIWTYWAFLQIPTWPKPKTKNFLLWITSNRLCLHVGLEFWTIFSFTCSESTSFTTCKIRFYTLYQLGSLAPNRSWLEVFEKVEHVLVSQETPKLQTVKLFSFFKNYIFLFIYHIVKWKQCYLRTLLIFFKY